MTNEVILNEEITTQEVETAEDYEAVECSGGKLGKIAGIGLILALGGAGIAVFKKKVSPKLEAMKVENLRKKGYVIYKEDECEVVELDDDVVGETTEAE